jgi:hypothetical protein
VKWSSEEIANVNVDFKVNIKDAKVSNPVRKFGIEFNRRTGELKIDKNIDYYFLIIIFLIMYKNKKYVRIIIRTLDNLWNEIKNNLPDVKPENII